MLTERLAKFVIETRASDVPPEAIAAARDAVIDTLGCALAGSLDESSELAAAYVRGIGARAQATVWGTNEATSPAEAAFVNGIFAHALDFDDTHVNVRGHPSATIVPAALAIAEIARVSGRDLLAAYCVGLDVGGKLGRAFGNGHYFRGWHSTATTGVFAAAAAAGRLAGLDVARQRHAFGIAASEASGLLRNFGTMTKPFHAGHAAACAVRAVLLAQAGFTADIAIFDGKDSFLATYAGADGEPFAGLVERLGHPWEALDPGLCVKRWPCCYCNHRSVGVLLQMMERDGVRAGEVEAVEIGFPPGTDTALISSDPRTGLEGKFSIEYVAAATLIDGAVGIDSFTDVRVNRPEIRALMAKVKRYRIEDKRSYSGSVGYNDVRVRTARGAFETRVDRTPGSPAWPVSAAERDAKFLDCAGRVLGTAGATRLLETASRAASLADAGELARASVPAASATGAARVPAGATVR